jgi:hypothetical protein
MQLTQRRITGDEQTAGISQMTVPGRKPSTNRSWRVSLVHLSWEHVLRRQATILHSNDSLTAPCRGSRRSIRPLA